LEALAGGGLCARLPNLDPERSYSLTFWVGLRNPKLEDPQAKSMEIYQEDVSLDTLRAPPPEIAERMRAACRTKLKL
jgi:hypothetical protein